MRYTDLRAFSLVMNDGILELINLVQPHNKYDLLFREI